MISDVREVIRHGMRIRMDGPLPEWITETYYLSVDEKVLALCLMIYYMQRDSSIHYACVGVFKHCLEQINSRKIASLETEIEREDVKLPFPKREDRVYIVLGNNFETKAKEMINMIGVEETDIEPIAEKLYSEYFG